MKRIIRYLLVFALVAFSVETALAQHPRFRERHQVKRKETIFGIHTLVEESASDEYAADNG